MAITLVLTLAPHLDYDYMFMFMCITKGSIYIFIQLLGICEYTHYFSNEKKYVIPKEKHYFTLYNWH